MGLHFEVMVPSLSSIEARIQTKTAKTDFLLPVEHMCDSIMLQSRELPMITAEKSTCLSPVTVRKSLGGEVFIRINLRQITDALPFMRWIQQTTMLAQKMDTARCAVL